MIVQTKLQRIEKCKAFLILWSDWLLHFCILWMQLSKRLHSVSRKYHGCFPSCFLLRTGIRHQTHMRKHAAWRTRKKETAKKLVPSTRLVSRSCLTRKRVGSFSTRTLYLCILKSSFRVCTQGMMRAEIRHDGLESKEAGRSKNKAGSRIICSDSKAKDAKSSMASNCAFWFFIDIAFKLLSFQASPMSSFFGSVGCKQVAESGK